MRTIRTTFGKLFGASLGRVVGHQLTVAAAALATIVTVATGMRPVYMGREPMVKRLVVAASAAEDSSATDARSRAPWALLASPDSAIGSQQFQADRQAFVVDLVATGHVAPARAESLATFAVREAYRKRVPPALVFGVLVTENNTFRSRARSNVGAVGLMQVHRKVWVPTLGKLFGRDLHDDETNLRYGVHILSANLYASAARALTAEGALSRGLLRYNGCVRGTNTRGCHRYPAKVRRAVERFAVAQCADGGYAKCVEEPIRLSIAAGEVVATR